MDLPGGRSEIVDVPPIRRIDSHPVGSAENCTPGTILDIKNLLNCTHDLDNPNDSEDDCAADAECGIEVDTNIEAPEGPEQRDVCAAPNISGLICPTQNPTQQAEQVFLTVYTIEQRRNEGIKKM